MNKARKNLIVGLMSFGLMIGTSVDAKAAENNSIEPTADVKALEYNYNSTEFQNYVNLNNGNTFSLTGAQSISGGSQAPKVSGSPCGVQYQIIKSGTTVKYVTKTGVYDRSLSVDLSNTSAKGSCIVRLMNYYSGTYTQTASGKFLY